MAPSCIKLYIKELNEGAIPNADVVMFYIHNSLCLHPFTLQGDTSGCYLDLVYIIGFKAKVMFQ